MTKHIKGDRGETVIMNKVVKRVKGKTGNIHKLLGVHQKYGWTVQSGERETAPELTSRIGRNTVLVLAYSFVVPWRAKLGFKLSMFP